MLLLRRYGLLEQDTLLSIAPPQSLPSPSTSLSLASAATKSIEPKQILAVYEPIDPKRM